MISRKRPGMKPSIWLRKNSPHFKQTHGPESVAWLRGMAADWGAQWDYANRLMNLFGSPNTIGNGSVCHVARDMAHVYTYGAMTLPLPKTSRCIVIWGKNDRNTAPGAAEAILHAKQQGAKLIVIDPVMTSFAKMADIWLQIKPGHDGQLAMAMINEIIANGLYDAEFVRDYCIGFDELKSAAAPTRPTWWPPRLWLDPEVIRQAARLYATTKPACIIDGNGIDMQLQVFQITRAVCMLRALTGNLDKDGGDFIPQPVPAQEYPMQGEAAGRGGAHHAGLPPVQRISRNLGAACPVVPGGCDPGRNPLSRSRCWWCSPAIR